MSATIKDIARETGLSLSTISKYLNNKSIQEQNKLLIEEAIRKLDYRPNRIAQSLRSERTMTVAVLLPDLGRPCLFYRQLFCGAGLYCHRVRL